MCTVQRTHTQQLRAQFTTLGHPKRVVSACLNGFHIHNKMHDVSVIRDNLRQFCHTEMNHFAKQIALFDRSSEL